MSLPDGFELGIVKTDEELEELVEFNSIVHREDDPEELRRMINYFPGFKREMNYFIRDLDKGKIVSSANAIPSIWMYEDISLRNLELGWVGTLKEYRKMGLIRALYSHFEEEMFRGEYDISTIQGIPYFYRQFGYDFILPMNRRVILRINQIPEVQAQHGPQWMAIGVRKANENDLEEMMTLYEEHNSRLLMHTKRNRELWQLQEKFRQQFETEFVTYVLESENHILGYLRVSVQGDPKNSNLGASLVVIESSIRTFDGVLRALQFIRKMAQDKTCNRISIVGPSTNNLCRLAEDLGGSVRSGWKHQVRIPNMVKFLERIHPVLERRLLSTMFEGLNYELPINAFTNCYLLNFKQGKITEIKDIGIQEVDTYRSFRTPPHDLARLVLGAYDIDTLSGYNVDFLVDGGIRSLVQTLFPKRESSIAYYYC